VDLKNPHDRSSSFDPQIIGKREVYLGEDLDRIAEARENY